MERLQRGHRVWCRLTASDRVPPCIASQSVMPALANTAQLAHSKRTCGSARTRTCTHGTHVRPRREGGIREPGLVRWPGKITPGQVLDAVVTTYDIFPTAMALAGVKLPVDRAFDGKDMSGVLFGAEPSAHDCLFHYKGTPGMNCPADKPNCPGLWAVRCGAYKTHFVATNASCTVL